MCEEMKSNCRTVDRLTGGPHLQMFFSVFSFGCAVYAKQGLSVFLGFSSNENRYSIYRREYIHIWAKKAS
jgi:hypothetical protein